MRRQILRLVLLFLLDKWEGLRRGCCSLVRFPWALKNLGLVSPLPGAIASISSIDILLYQSIPGYIRYRKLSVPGISEYMENNIPCITRNSWCEDYTKFIRRIENKKFPKPILVSGYDLRNVLHYILMLTKPINSLLTDWCININ